MVDEDVRFDMKRDYATKALKSPAIAMMINEKVALAKALYFQRVKKRSGENARSTRTKVSMGGEKFDRFEGTLTAYAPHALAREFGIVRERGGDYTEAVARRYGRSVKGRALKRSAREAVLGGDNRKRQSIVKSLEEL